MECSGALSETAVGAINPAKTLQNATRVATVLNNAENVAQGVKAISKGTFPDHVFSGKVPMQVTPGTKMVTQERYNIKTGEFERSNIGFDQYGRQVHRTDYTQHGYNDKSDPKTYHSNPHEHTYEYGPGYNPSKETRTNKNE